MFVDGCACALSLQQQVGEDCVFFSVPYIVCDAIACLCVWYASVHVFQDGMKSATCRYGFLFGN